MDNKFELAIEYLPVDALNPYEHNAKKHTDKDINSTAASIKKFGFDDPIGIWGEGQYHCGRTWAVAGG